MPVHRTKTSEDQGSTKHLERNNVQCIYYIGKRKCEDENKRPSM